MFGESETDHLLTIPRIRHELETVPEEEGTYSQAGMIDGERARVGHRVLLRG